MRLLDLNPKWLMQDGRKVGILFNCPHCSTSGQRLSCFFAPTPIGQQFLLFEQVLEDEGDADPYWNARKVVPCNQQKAWERKGEDFGGLSITPSLNSEAAGHWHGYITNGEIVTS